MIKRVFVDTNVMLDFLTRREPHFFSAEKLFELSYDRKIQMVISSLSFITSHFILHKQGISETSIRKLLKNVCAICKVVKIDQDTIINAISSTFVDMEDGVQYLCAVEAQADIIVTRNEKDFKQSQITVMHPSELVSFFETKI